MRSAGMRHSGSSPSSSNSDHTAFRSSPGRTNTRGARRKADATGSVPLKPAIARSSSPTRFGSVMLAWWRSCTGLEDPMQAATWIPFGYFVMVRVLEDRVAQLQNAMSGFNSTSGLDSTKHVANLRALDITDSCRADPRETRAARTSASSRISGTRCVRYCTPLGITMPNSLSNPRS